MESIKTFFFLCCVILYVTQFPNPTGAASLVEKVCQHSHNKENCIETFASNPDSKTASLRQLGLIALKIAAQNATNTSLYIQKLLNNQSLEAGLQQSLSDCLDNYIDANDQLDDSVAAVLANADQDVRTWINAAIADIKSCEDGFAQNGGNPAVLKKRNSSFRQLCNNVLAINKLLIRKQKPQAHAPSPH